MNADGSDQRQLTSDPAWDGDPAWSPDGCDRAPRSGPRSQPSCAGAPSQATPRRIAFTSDRGGSKDVYVMDADGSNVVQLTHSAGTDENPAWSPDGTRIVFVSGDGGRDVLRGGPGNDALHARDGTRDVVDGGPGIDAGRWDRPTA